MGNTDSVPINNDRPALLVLDAKLNVERGFHAAAITKYKRSYDLYKEAGLMASAGKSLSLAAETGLQMVNPDYELAATAFEEVGTLYLLSEITAIVAKYSFANAIFCLLAAGRIATAKGKYTDFVAKDTRFAASLEGVASKAIIDAYQNGNKSQALDRVDSYKDIKTIPVWRSSLLDAIVNRL